MSRYDAGRRGGIARGNQILDDAIARYEEKLAEIHERAPHLKETTLA